MSQTPFQYYSDEENWGKYQYVTLKDVIDFMVLETQDDDSYLKNVKRSKLLAYAKQGIRLLHRTVTNKVNSFQIEVPTNLKWALPQDYIDYVRVSRFVQNTDTGGYRLFPLDINNNIPTAVDYLQDNAFELLFDSDGYILQAEGLNATSQPYIKIPFEHYGGQSMTDTSKFSKNGEFKVDEERGFFVFSSDLAEQYILIEYVSDGLENNLWGEEIKVHKRVREALQDYIYFECISRRRNVPLFEKRQAENKWLSSRHKAVLDRSNIDLMAVSRISRKKSMIP